MAKLSAHGYEIARVYTERETPDNDLTIWDKITLSFRSDGHILRKLDTRFKPDRYDPQGRRHSYGWKLHKRFRAKKNVTRDQIENTVRILCEKYGWRRNR